MRQIAVVHAIATDEILTRRNFFACAVAVMRALGPRGAVHLRGRTVSARFLYDMAAALAAEQDRVGAWLIVNDRLDVALASGAIGVQLRARSLSVTDAQRVSSAATTSARSRGATPLIGASVHSVEEAATAGLAGADWLVAGHVFDTPTHAGEPGRGVGFVRAIASLGAPVIVIGGVRPDDVPALRDAGASGIAAIRGIWGHVSNGGTGRGDGRSAEASDENAERAATRYLSLYEGSSGS